MKIKTSELTDADLDWAVSQIEGKYKYYSIDWYAAGPIIEREKINLWTEGYDWEATQYGKWQEWGPTALIAAMRCYVGTKLGNEVDVPEVCLDDK